MKPCTVLETLYSKHPDLMSREMYQEHIKNCPRCKADEADFEAFIHTLGEAFGETDAARRAHAPSLEARHRLMAALEGRRSLFPAHRPRAIRWATAASVLFISALLLFYLSRRDAVPQTDSVRETTVSVTRFVEGADLSEEVPAPPLDALVTGSAEQLRIRINADGLNVMEETRLAVTDTRRAQTRIRLDRGTVDFSVAKRSAGDTFLVDAAPFQIRVIGTRFSVTREENRELTVAVSEGVVEVVGPDSPPHAIAAGESVHFSGGRRSNLNPTTLAETVIVPPSTDVEADIDEAAASADPNGELSFEGPRKGGRANGGAAHPKRRSDMDMWRGMVVAGAYNQVENELHAHLAYRPNDWQAWSLLAVCLRKDRKWSQSVAAYQKSIELAPPMEANRSRLAAGAVLQNYLGQHREAVRLLEDYLQLSDDGASLKAEVMVRLATSYAKLGQLDRARELLVKVVHQHRGNPVAKKAQDLLRRISPASSDEAK